MTGETRDTARPVSAAERFASLDRLRGVAILGILVMNIYAFAMPFAAYVNPLRMGGTELHNLGTWFLTHILFDQKFLSIFAMLFGAGIVLMSERAEARGTKPAVFYYRRQRRGITRRGRGPRRRAAAVARTVATTANVPVPD